MFPWICLFDQVGSALKTLEVELSSKWSYTKNGPNLVKTWFWNSPKKQLINMSLPKRWLSLENFRALASLEVELGQIWPLLSRYGLTWPDLTWPSLTWSNLTWPGLAWPGLTWPDLTWPDLSRPGLAWPDLSRKFGSIPSRGNQDNMSSSYMSRQKQRQKHRNRPKNLL